MEAVQAHWSTEPAEQEDDGGGGQDAMLKLGADVGSCVEATFPFSGDPEGDQLSFQIGDTIKVLEKDELWSWGQLVKNGKEGWFPHNYVQAAFQPLPGMHELKQRMLIKKAREEAIANGEDPDAAEWAVLNPGEPEPEPVTSLPTPVMLPAPEPGPVIQEAWKPLPLPPPTGPDMFAGVDVGLATQPGNDLDLDFGMWLEYLDDDDRSAVGSSEPEIAAVVPAHASEHRGKRRSCSRLQRENIARELLETEEKYVKLLEALTATIIRPCLGKASPIPKEEATSIFSALRAEEILSINTALRDQIRSRVRTLDDDTCFGDLFIQFAPFLKMYVEYCTQHESTSRRVSSLQQQNDRFRGMLNRSLVDPRSEGIDVQSLLIMPIQRIPRYKLLLENMMKNTDEDHTDYNLLQKAVDQISDVASFINDSIKRRENQAKIWGIQAQLSEAVDLAQPFRIHIKDGIMQKVGRYSDRMDFFALFNDGLLHAKFSRFGNNLIFKRMGAVLECEDVTRLVSKPKALHPFRVVTSGHIYLLSARSHAEKEAWLRVLTLCIKGGRRKLVHKGNLGVLSLSKDTGAVREDFFYVFSDVIVRGKSLWKGKFKHKETLELDAVEETFRIDPRWATGLPRELLHPAAVDRCFRLVHRKGAAIVIAKSMAAKRQWLEAIYKHLAMRKKDQQGRRNTLKDAQRPLHEGNFMDALEDSEDDSAPEAHSTRNGIKAGYSRDKDWKDTSRAKKERSSTKSSRNSSGSSVKPSQENLLDLDECFLDPSPVTAAKPVPTAGNVDLLDNNPDQLGNDLANIFATHTRVLAAPGIATAQRESEPFIHAQQQQQQQRQQLYASQHPGPGQHYGTAMAHQYQEHAYQSYQHQQHHNR
ncbi:unnamed protein product [Chrysoparadoxa australica]